MSLYSDCYCGCKLNSDTLKWSCKIFDKVKDADNYALQDREKSKATKILILPCFYKHGYKEILKKIVEPSLYFGIEFEKD
jgi:hypothetical protein